MKQRFRMKPKNKVHGYYHPYYSEKMVQRENKAWHLIAAISIILIVIFIIFK